MKTVRLALGLGLALACATVAASVTFDAETGTGFVGKGDVQLAFGWNNAQLQNNAGAVTFTYAMKATYDVTCEWDTFTGSNNPNDGGTRRTIHHEVTDGLSLASNATFASTTRSNKQGDVTGFLLRGYSAEAPTGNAPVIGDVDFCNAHDMGPAYNENTSSHTGAVVTAVELLEGSESAGLFVNFGDQSVQLN